MSALSAAETTVSQDPKPWVCPLGNRYSFPAFADVRFDPRPELQVSKASGCGCVVHRDGSVTTLLCSAHAEQDPCLTMSNVTGRRRRGTIRRGVCTHCGWGAS